MLRTLLFLALLTLFLVGASSVLRRGMLMKRLVRRVGEIDPEKKRELTELDLPVLSGLTWLNPRRFDRFLKSGDSRGDAELERYMDALRKPQTALVVSWLSMMLLLVVLGLVAFVRSS